MGGYPHLQDLPEKLKLKIKIFLCADGSMRLKLEIGYSIRLLKVSSYHTIS